MSLLIAYLSSKQHDLGMMLDDPHITLQSYPASYSIHQVLRSAIRKTENQHALIIRNTDVLLLPAFIQQVQAVAAHLDATYRWLVAAAAGRGLDTQFYHAIYNAQQPQLVKFLGIAGLIDIIPDMYLLNLHSLADILPDSATLIPNDKIEKWLIQQGYHKQYLTLYHPALRYATPYLVPYELAQERRTLIRGLVDTPLLEATLNDFNHALETTLIQNCKLPSISIITRTQFKRLPLLRRLLASVSRALRAADAVVECILATDMPIDSIQPIFAELTQAYPYLKLRLAHQAPHHTASRVANLLNGIRTAQNDYVWIIDDDDFIYPSAFQDLRGTLLGEQPLFVVCSSDVLAEEWFFQNDYQAVRTQFRLEKTYHATDWRNVFSGMNPLPICSYITPREFITTRLADFVFQHDLSEDYALLLLLLTAPQLPPIVEITAALVGISVRTAGDNVVNVVDRTHWLAQIYLFLGDLQISSGVASGGQWQLYTLLDKPSDADFGAAQIKNLQDHNTTYRERIVELEAESESLHSLLVGLQIRYASDRHYRRYQRWKDKIQGRKSNRSLASMLQNTRWLQLFRTAFHIGRTAGLLPMFGQFLRWLRRKPRS
jgi:Glycosyl transferase family 2